MPCEGNSAADDLERPRRFQVTGSSNSTVRLARASTGTRTKFINSSTGLAVRHARTGTIVQAKSGPLAHRGCRQLQCDAIEDVTHRDGDLVGSNTGNGTLGADNAGSQHLRPCRGHRREPCDLGHGHCE